jgi:hypothetical protein
MASNYSDLEAVHDYQQPGPEHNPMIQHQVLPGKYSAQYNDAQYAPKNYGDQYQYPAAPPPPPHKLWGLKPKTFWVVFGIISIVVIGAAQSHKSKSSSDSNSNSNSTPISTTTNLTPSLITTPVVGPCSNNTLYTISPSTSNSQSFRKICGLAFVKAASVPITENVVLTQTTTLDDCIGLCAAYNEANKTSIAGGADYVCNAVCWRNGFVNDDFPAACFGFMAANSTGSGSGSFQTTEQSICDGAGWIDQRQLT